MICLPKTDKFPNFTLKLLPDNNKNNIYDNPPDTPIANTVIVLVFPVPKSSRDARASPPVLGRTRTDSEGNFVMTFDKQSPGVTLNVVKDNERYVPLLQFQTNAQGGADIDVPVLRPPTPSVVPPLDLLDNKVTVHGVNGTAGHTIYLYTNSGATRVGQTIVESNGHFTIVSSALPSGLQTLVITQADDKNAGGFQRWV